MMCYYLNVHFQGQRIKFSYTLHSTTTGTCGCIQDRRLCVIQSVPESCYVKPSLTGVLFPPDKEGGRLDTGQSWQQMFVRNFSFPKESVPLFKVNGYVLEFFSSSLSPRLF